ncbi:MAG TPA: hypothetical protein VIG67_07110 [Yaniella sp.]
MTALISRAGPAAHRIRRPHHLRFLEAGKVTNIFLHRYDSEETQDETQSVEALFDQFDTAGVPQTDDQ